MEAKKSKRGFGTMNPSQQRAIASMGGKAAHNQGKAHEFTSDEAREAGRKGGETVSRDRKHMADIGRIGGQARSRRQASSEPPHAPAPANTSASAPAANTASTATPHAP